LLGQQVTKRRLEMRKNLKDPARELVVSVKPPWGMEN
jgi:hypothetical protein